MIGGIEDLAEKIWALFPRIVSPEDFAFEVDYEISWADLVKCLAGFSAIILPLAAIVEGYSPDSYSIVDEFIWQIYSIVFALFICGLYSVCYAVLNLGGDLDFIDILKRVSFNYIFFNAIGIVPITIIAESSLDSSTIYYFYSFILLLVSFVVFNPPFLRAALSYVAFIFFGNIVVVSLGLLIPELGLFYANMLADL